MTKITESANELLVLQQFESLGYIYLWIQKEFEV